MVEKWLVQVESMMIQSLKDITAQALQAAAVGNRSEWVKKWPGQVRFSKNFIKQFIYFYKIR